MSMPAINTTPEEALRAATAAFHMRKRGRLTMPTKEWEELVRTGQRRHDSIVGDLPRGERGQWKGDQR